MAKTTYNLPPTIALPAGLVRLETMAQVVAFQDQAPKTAYISGLLNYWRVVPAKQFRQNPETGAKLCFGVDVLNKTTAAQVVKALLAHPTMRGRRGFKNCYNPLGGMCPKEIHDAFAALGWRVPGDKDTPLQAIPVIKPTVAKPAATKATVRKAKRGTSGVPAVIPVQPGQQVGLLTDSDA